MAWLPREEKTKNKTERNRNTSITNRAGEKEPNGRACVATKSIRSEKKILKTSQEMFSNAPSAEIWDESSLHHRMVSYLQSEPRVERIEMIVMLITIAAVPALKKLLLCAGHCVEHLIFALTHLILARMLPLLLLSSWF